MKWEDATTYSRGQERIPTSWRLNVGGLHIAVVSNHRYNPGQWLMHCSPWYDAHDLGMPADQFDKEQAQQRALALVRARVQKILDALQVSA
jgi:hypothetical protein